MVQDLKLVAVKPAVNFELNHAMVTWPVCAHRVAVGARRSSQAFGMHKREVSDVSDASPKLLKTLNSKFT